MPKKPIIEEPKRNFLVVELGDNDFSYRMQSALEELRDYWASEGNIQHHCAYSIKNFIVAHVVSYDWKKRCLEGDWREHAAPGEVRFDESLIIYMQDIRVTFREKMPTYTPYEDDQTLIDHGGGSVAMDLNTGYVFQF